MAETKSYFNTPMNLFKERNHQIIMEDIIRGDKQMFDREMFILQFAAIKTENQLIKDICKQVVHGR